MKTDIACDYAALYSAAIEEGLGYLVYSQEGVVFTLNIPGSTEQYSLRLGDEEFSAIAKNAIVKHFTGDATIASLFAALIECTMIEGFNKGVPLYASSPPTKPCGRDPYDNHEWPPATTSKPLDFGTTKPPTPPRGWGYGPQVNTPPPYGREFFRAC